METTTAWGYFWLKLPLNARQASDGGTFTHQTRQGNLGTWSASTTHTRQVFSYLVASVAIWETWGANANSAGLCDFPNPTHIWHVQTQMCSRLCTSFETPPTDAVCHPAPSIHRKRAVNTALNLCQLIGYWNRAFPVMLKCGRATCPCASAACGSVTVLWRWSYCLCDEGMLDQACEAWYQATDTPHKICFHVHKNQWGGFLLRVREGDKASKFRNILQK